MKTRRHHNNKGTRQIGRGKTHDQVKAMARRLKVPFGPARQIQEGDVVPSPLVFDPARFPYNDNLESSEGNPLVTYLKRRYLSPSEKVIVRARQGNRCICGCKEPLENGVHYDHKRPLWDGGTNDLDNFQALKPGHHIKKSAKEAKTRAKLARIKEQDGLRKPKRSKVQKFLEQRFGEGKQQ